MKKIIIVVTIMLVSVLAGCGNASATSEQIAPKPEENITASEAPVAAVQKTAENPQNNEGTVGVEEATPRTKNVDWQDYVENGVFYMDNYAEAIGYTVIKANKSHSWYIYDTLQHHYCIVAYSSSLNIMIDCSDAAYSISMNEGSTTSERISQCVQNDIVELPRQWVEESTAILKLITTGAEVSESDIHYYPIASSEVMCTKWSENFVVDERGVALDSQGSAELLWKVNYPN